MSIDAGSVYSAVRIKLDALDKDLQEVRSRFVTLEGNIENVPVKGQNAFGKFFGFLKTSGVGAFLGVSAVVAGLTRYFGDSIKVARDAQETYSKFGVVFGGIKDDADDVAKAFAKSFDLAGSTARKLLGDTGNLLTGMGATQSQALDLSLQVNTLAADLASFTNNEGGAEAAAHALTSAMLGEREQAKSLGIVIREADVQQRLLEKGQKDLTGEAKLLATAQATLEIATSQSKNAIGDYARTSDSAANAQKRAAEASKQLKVAIGTGLNPIATVTANLFSTIATKIAEVVEQANKHREALQTKDENRTIEQRILLIDEEIKIRQANMRTAQTMDEQGRIINSQTALDEEKKIASLNKEREMLDNLDIYKKKGNKEKIAATEAEIAAEKRNREAIALVAEAHDKVKKAIADSELSSRVLGTGMLSNKEMADLYGGAIIEVLSDTRGLVSESNKLLDPLKKAMQAYGMAAEEVDAWLAGMEAWTEAGEKQKEAQERAARGTREAQAAMDAFNQSANKGVTVVSELTEGQKSLADAQKYAADVAELWNQSSEALSAYSSLVENQNALELIAMKKAGASEEEIAKKRNELNEKAFNAHKAQAIAEALINGAVATSKVWGQTGIFGIAAQVPVIAMTAAQVGLIAAQPYVPSAATGGIVLPRDGGTMVRTAENRRPELLLNDSAEGSAVLDAFADRIVASMGSRQIAATSAPVYMDGKEIAKIVTRYQDNNLAGRKKR